MRHQKAVDRAHALAVELMADIGRRVDEHGESALAAPSDHRAAVAAPGPRMLARLLAGGALAEERRHAAAGAGAHERERVGEAVGHGRPPSQTNVTGDGPSVTSE